ncbi:MAG TPA: hypothetical protein PL124_11945 [Candidatus Cloacimonadota bacterium]|jgi:hypothetical protein|nr:hypothetical protein [Candidatus Cloacimonadota bacterium]
MTLKELYATGNYDTDKGYHSYLPLYDDLFAPFRDQKINLLEVGYFKGGSLRLWEDYFTKALIHGIDITDEYRQESGAAFQSGRVTTSVMNIRHLCSEDMAYNPPDIAIDDGSHKIQDQLIFIETVLPMLRPGGILIVEDISYLEKVGHLFRDMGAEIIDLRSKRLLGDDVLAIFRK